MGPTIGLATFCACDWLLLSSSMQKDEIRLQGRGNGSNNDLFYSMKFINVNLQGYPRLALSLHVMDWVSSSMWKAEILLQERGNGSNDKLLFYGIHQSKPSASCSHRHLRLALMPFENSWQPKATKRGPFYRNCTIRPLQGQGSAWLMHTC